MGYHTVLFDLDGTLTDPAVGICTSVQYALEKAGRKPGPLEEYYRWIGPPLAYSFEVYAGATPEEAGQMVAFYRERYSTVGLFENQVYPGILELLGRLKKAGLRLAVATGKPTGFSQRILDRFGLAGYLDCVSRSSLSDRSPDKCNIIRHALYELGVRDLDGCVMVGDRSHDAVGAKMSGVDFIGVLYGYGSREELEAEGAEKLADSPAALGTLLGL